MARPRFVRRDGFTATGSGGRLDDGFGHQEVPPFVAKYRDPPYLNKRIIRSRKGSQGDD